jgi:hypothetical protein
VQNKQIAQTGLNEKRDGLTKWMKIGYQYQRHGSYVRLLHQYPTGPQESSRNGDYGTEWQMWYHEPNGLRI